MLFDETCFPTYGRPRKNRKRHRTPNPRRFFVYADSEMLTATRPRPCFNGRDDEPRGQRDRCTGPPPRPTGRITHHTRRKTLLVTAAILFGGFTQSTTGIGFVDAHTDERTSHHLVNLSAKAREAK